MYELLNGWTPYVLPMLWIAFGLWGWTAYRMYFGGKWRRWTIRYSVIGCLVLNLMLLILFCAMWTLSDYIGDWDDKSTILMIVTLAAICIFHSAILIAHWTTPVRINQKESENA